MQRCIFLNPRRFSQSGSGMLHRVYLLSSLRLALGVQPTRGLWKSAATTEDERKTSLGVFGSFYIHSECRNI